jgi:hypothetical protein
VPLVSQRTLADRIGAWPQAVIVALTLAALAWAAAAAFRRRRGRQVTAATCLAAFCPPTADNA